jgi:putative ABC transport system permease protein
MRHWRTMFSTLWTSLTTHKLRSFLTMLGIIIGVASVITLMSIGRGTTAQILSHIESMGANLIIIRPGAGFGPGGIRGAGGSVQSLTVEDATAIAQQIPYISAVAPSFSTNLQLVVGNRNTNAQIIGTTPEYASVNNLKLAEGAFFSQEEYRRAAKVAVLGSDVAETLFGELSPVGQKVRMGNMIVAIIGVLESKGGGFNSPDEAAIIPLTTLQQSVSLTRTAQGERVVSSIYLTVSDEKHTDYVVEQITNLLRSRHRLSASAENDFNVMSMKEIASALEETSGTLTLLLGAIAAISLLVGGIGVMNIMLVSVLERTREIGIRKALGARERDIWIQFLAEAASLTFTGGILGVLFGVAISTLLERMGIVNTLVTPDIVILAVSVSIVIGLFFGFYPAWSASRLDPIQALRSE